MERCSWLIASTEPSGGHGGHAVWWAPILFSVLACAIIVVTGRLALRGAKVNVPKTMLTRVYEHLYLFIENMCTGVIGAHGKKYIPLVFTLYMFVLVSNMLGLFGLMAPTSQLGVTFGLAVMVVIYVQGEGIRANGPIGYIKHFFGPPLGPWLIPVTILLFFIELISEVAKMLSLSLRLQGNMAGEHKVGEVIGTLISVPIGGDQVFHVPVQALLFPLGVFVCLVQALVFTMLTCVYLSLFTSHEHADESSHEAAHAH